MSAARELALTGGASATSTPGSAARNDEQRRPGVGDNAVGSRRSAANASARVGLPAAGLGRVGATRGRAGLRGGARGGGAPPPPPAAEPAAEPPLAGPALPPAEPAAEPAVEPAADPAAE